MRWRVWGLALGLALSAPLVTPPAAPLAQGRYQGSTEAEKLLAEGRRLEEEAAALKEQRPDEAEDRYEEAVGRYLEAIRSDPELVAAYVRLGYTFYALERNEKAVDLLRPALQRWPDHVELHRVYGTVLYGMMGRRDEAVGHLERVHKATATDPDYFDVAFLLGKHHYEARDWPRAAAAFRAYLAAQPEDVRIHGTLGNVYLKTDKLEPALAEFRFVLSLEPGNVPAQINIANIRFRQGRWDDAIAGFSAVLKDNPRHIGVHFNLASSYYQAGRWDEALTHYEAHASHRPKHVPTRYMIGLCHLDKGEVAEAREALEATLEVAPEHARAHWRLGMLDHDAGDLGGALARLEKAHALQPDHAWTLIALGDVQRDRGELADAVARHQEAIRLDARNPAGHVGLGRDHFVGGDFAQARDAFGRAWGLERRGLHAELYAVALVRHGRERLAAGQAGAAQEAARDVLRLGQPQKGDPPSARASAARVLEAHLLLAAAALAGGDEAEAARQVAAAVQINPEHPQVRLAAARAALMKGDPARAVAQLSPLLKEGRAPSAAVATTLGRAAAAQQRWGASLEWFVQARDLGLAPEAAERNVAVASLRLGEASSQTEDWRGAVGALKGAEALRGRLTPLEAIRLDLALGVAYAEANNYGKALGKLKQGVAALRKLPVRERAALPGADEAALDLRLAYVHYRLGQWERAIALIERRRFKPGPQQVQARQLLANAYVRQASKLFRAGRARPAELLLRKAQRADRRDEAVRHNLAVLDYAKGRHAKAAAVFKAARGVPEAVFNQAIYLDDVKRDKKRAFELYGQVAARGGRRAPEAKREVAIKKRVFGFGVKEP